MAKTSGVKVVEDNRKTVEIGIQSAVQRALEEIGLLAEGYAKKLCPVDTGRLRNSITHDVWYGGIGGNAVYVGTNVEYAPYVELGTRKQRAQPYLRPAAENHASQYRGVLRRNLESA